MDKKVLRDIQYKKFIKFLGEERASYNNENSYNSFSGLLDSVESQVNLSENDYIRSSTLLNVYRKKRNQIKIKIKRNIRFGTNKEILIKRIEFYNTRIRDLENRLIEIQKKFIELREYYRKYKVFF